MMALTKRIVYPSGDGIAVIAPCECVYSVHQIALKDVPAGVPFVIVDATDIPADRTYRAAWRADFSTPDGYGIGPEAFAAAIVPPPQPEQDSGEGTDNAYPRLPS